MWKAFPDDYSMRVAFWLMCKKLYVSAKTYEKIKSNLQISEEHKKKLRDRQFSQETRIKMSSAKKGKPPHNKGKPSPNKGKPISEEQKKQISLRHKGKTLSPETRQKISESQKGKPGHPHSEEAKQKMRKPKSEEAKQKNEFLCQRQV